MPKGAALAIATALTIAGALLWFNGAPLAGLFLFVSAAVFDNVFVRTLADERRRKG